MNLCEPVLTILTGIFQCLRVRDRVTLRNSDISVDYPAIFFSDEQRQVQVIEEFMESIQNSPKIAKRNDRNSTKPFIRK